MGIADRIEADGRVQRLPHQTRRKHLGAPHCRQPQHFNGGESQREILLLPQSGGQFQSRQCLCKFGQMAFNCR